MTSLEGALPAATPAATEKAGKDEDVETGEGAAGSSASAPASPPGPTTAASSSAPQDGVMARQDREAFEAELARLKAANTSGPLDRRLAAVGVVMVVVGAVVILTCYGQARNFDDLRDQMEVVVLALLGLGLMVTGSVLYLRNSMTRFMRYWLLRLVYEQRRDMAPVARPGAGTATGPGAGPGEAG